MRSASYPAVLVAALAAACGGTTSRAPSSQGPEPCSGGACVVAISGARSAGGCALLEGGQVRCWGSNTWGQLGTDTIPAGAGQRSLVPVPVVSVAGASAIGVGEWDGCAVVAGGEVRCWGDNAEGQLGAPAPAFQAVPRPIPALSGATAVATGQQHVCALASGAVRCWGYNADGELGDGTTTKRYDPVNVSSIADATAIAAGPGHTCAIVSGGTVKCWGSNGSGQLGNRAVDMGRTSSHSVDPVEVTSLTGATALAAGLQFTCALLQEGRVKCWGGNSRGELGTATRYVDEPDPVLVGSVSGATAITAGEGHACAVVSGGAVRCWGYNGDGQLGNGSTAGTIANGLGWTAEDVPGLTGVTQLSAGYGHTCALVRGKGVKCWGYNASGQLGDGSTTERHAPVDVVF